MGDLVPFEFEGIPVRVVDQNGDHWWVLADVSFVLDYRMASDAARLLDPDEKGTHIMRTLGGDQEMVICSEPGLYKLISRSRKSAAKRFDRWIRHEVLPSLRKTGRYVMAGAENALEATIERAWNKQAALIGVQFATQGAAIQRVETGLAETKAEVVRLHEKVDDLAPRRKYFTLDTQRQYRAMCHLKNEGKCYCGCGRKILDDQGNEIPECYRIDHLHGRHRVGPRDGLPVHKICNQEFENDTSLREKRLKHRAPLFHEEREEMFPSGKFDDPNQFKLALI